MVDGGEWRVAAGNWNELLWIMDNKANSTVRKI